MSGLVVVAMSGGVDSSVAAGLLKEAGYDVVGLTMRLYSEADTAAPAGKRSCCGVEAVDEARATAQVLGIPYYVLNFEREFGERVVDYFVDSYARGETPNPCLACNRELKFNVLLKKAAAMGADYLATGHYARIERHASGYALRQAADALKDQSYVLFNLTQRELRRILMPVGGYSKQEIRSHAVRMGLPVADKPESQDICFIPDRDYRAFVRRQGLQPLPGTLVNPAGEVVGRHGGVQDFTVGQRRRIGVASPVPLYVRNVDAASGAVTVAPREQLGAISAQLRSVSFVNGMPTHSFSTGVRLRYRAALADATVTVDGQTATVAFAEPQAAVTPGQAAVFYDGEYVLGGGIIDAVRFAD
jgi:tRNA-specific 2-thiouridylase